MNRYPESPLVDSCNALIKELRTKLELKSFEKSSLYFKMEKYLIDKRMEQMSKEGVSFKCNVKIGEDISVKEIFKNTFQVLLDNKILKTPMKKDLKLFIIFSVLGSI